MVYTKLSAMNNMKKYIGQTKGKLMTWLKEQRTSSTF